MQITMTRFSGKTLTANRNVDALRLVATVLFWFLLYIKMKTVTRVFEVYSRDSVFKTAQFGEKTVKLATLHHRHLNSNLCIL